MKTQSNFLSTLLVSVIVMATSFTLISCEDKAEDIQPSEEVIDATTEPNTNGDISLNARIQRCGGTGYNARLSRTFIKRGDSVQVIKSCSRAKNVYYFPANQTLYTSMQLKLIARDDQFVSDHRTSSTYTWKVPANMSPGNYKLYVLNAQALAVPRETFKVSGE